MESYCLTDAGFQVGKTKRVLEMDATVWFSSQTVVFGVYKLKNKNTQDSFLTFRKQQACERIQADTFTYIRDWV